ncbi:MAG: MFS transporter [Terriglobia bacterium]
MSADSVPASDTKPRPSSALPRNVQALGWVAFFNDTATEMSYWLLPQFMVTILGAGPIAFGLMEGAAETMASFGKLISGTLSDRLRRRKPLVATGYTAANLAKPLLALAQSWGQVFWIRFIDRAAKGFRAAPRDALMAESVPPGKRGAAFGFRQSMDSAGAFVGPLAAVLLLPVFLGNVRYVFWAASLPGLASILLAWFAVREIRPADLPSGVDRPRLLDALRGSDRRLLVILFAVALFSLGNSSDLFLILRAQNLGVRGELAPILGLIFNLVYTFLSWPIGKLSDRIPRRGLIVLGYVIYSGVYFGFARTHSAQIVWLLMPLYGLYYALTEGVLKAWISDLVPSHSRASVFGLFHWVVGVTAFPASLFAGWLWQHYAPAIPFYFSGILALFSAFLLAVA